jgi:hypothetical protein
VYLCWSDESIGKADRRDALPLPPVPPTVYLGEKLADPYRSPCCDRLDCPDIADKLESALHRGAILPCRFAFDILPSEQGNARSSASRAFQSDPILEELEVMKPEKTKLLESKGWRVGSAEEFLELTSREAALVELRLKIERSHQAV